VSLNPLRWPRNIKLIVAFGVLYVVWGSTYLGIRIGLEAGLPPTLFAGLRLVPAGLLLLAFAKWRGKKLRIPLAEFRIVATVGILLLVGGMYFTFLAERSIPSGLAALIVALLPLWIALAEFALPDMEKPSARGVLGLIIGFSGLGILMAPRITGIHGSPEQFLGIGLQILGTWLWTSGSVLSKRRPVKTDALVATGYEMLSAGVVLLVIGTLLGEWVGFTMTPSGAGALAYLIVMGSCVAFTAFVWLLRNAPASKVMTYAYVNPVIAVFLGWLVLREPIDGWVLAGMAVIVTGVALTTSAPTKPGKAAAPVPSAETLLAAEEAELVAEASGVGDVDSFS
jgi:drug/metabolite transporter (DMT)-like permease